jgi:hypothetical protein
MTKMTLRDRLTLSAFEKYRRYGRVPWKFICHILLLAFSTAQILLWNLEDGSYYRATNRNWQYWFMYRPTTTSRCDLYTYDQVVDSFNETIMNYYNIDQLSVDSYRTHFSASENHRGGGRGNTPGTAAAAAAAAGASSSVSSSSSSSSFSASSSSSSSTSSAAAPLPSLPSPSVGPTAPTSSRPSAPTLVYTYYLHPESLFDYRVVEPQMSVGSTTYTINASYSGPFDAATLGLATVVANINRLQHAVLTLRLDSFIFGTVYRSCLEWEVSVAWNFEDRGQVTQSVNSRVVGNCNVVSWNEALSYQLMWLNIPILLIASLYLLLTIKAVVRSIQTFMVIRRRQRLLESDRENGTSGATALSPGRSRRQLRSHRWHGEPVTWNTLSCEDKCKFFSVWFVMTMLGCMCLILLSLSNLINIKAHSPTDNGPKLLAGLGCALIWFSLLAYFEHNKGYYILVVTLKKGVPRVARFMVGVMPMMLGYAFFGMVCFGSYSDRFESFSASMITLFAVLNGDVIRETFLNLDNGDFVVVSQVYMYTFICLFIYVVLNVFIAIIEEAFFSAWEVVQVPSSGGGAGDGGRGGTATRSQSQAQTQAERHSHTTDGIGGDGGNKESTVQRDTHDSPDHEHSAHNADGETKTKKSARFAPNVVSPPLLRRDHSEPMDMSPRSQQSMSVMTGLMSKNEQEDMSGQSWNRFRELLHNINEDELLRRHEALHTSDMLMHEEIERRNTTPTKE